MQLRLHIIRPAYMIVVMSTWVDLENFLGGEPNRVGIKVVQLNVLIAITAKNFISDIPYTSIINQHQGGPCLWMVISK